MYFSAMADQVSFICKRTVVSTKPVQPGKHFPLSVLDRVMDGNHLHVVLYYQSPAGGERGEVTKKLRESLSEMLSSFPAMTGRLVKTEEGRWVVKCNDAGVRMVEATAKGRVEEWLVGVDREKELKLVHWEEMFHKPYFWSTFYVQLTEFEGGGLAIGLSCTHLLADPPCATMFLQAWADTTSLGGKILSPPIFHPLPPRRPFNKNTNHHLYTRLIDNYKSNMEKLPLTPTLTLHHRTTVTLSFSDQTTLACMATVGTPSAPFEALAALFWICISHAKGLQSGLLDLSIGLDMRKILGLDKGFFGNCMVYNKLHGEGFRRSVLQANENLLSEAAFAISQMVGEMDIEGTMDLIEWLERNDNYQSSPLMNGHDCVMCANLEGLGSYSAVFEDGLKPIHGSYYIEPAVGLGQVLILPSPAGDGPFSRVVMVTLPEGEIVKMLEDAILLQFSPTMIMGMNKN